MDRKPIPDNRIRRIMDAGLPGLEQQPWFEERVLQRIRQAEEEGEKPVRGRRKLSVVLVVALALVLIAATAVAATMLYRYYARNIAVEAAHGYYQAWPLDEKIAMVDRMLEEGIEIDAAQAARLHDRSLTDEEKEVIADGIVIGYYGEGHDGVLSAANIMEHDMGQFNTWSLEDQAWFSEQQLASGHEQATYEFHKMPGENDMPADKAVAHARDLLTEVYDIDIEELKTWKTIVSFSSEQISDGVNPTHMEDIYEIGFFEPGNDVHPYWVQLSHDGKLMHMSEPFRERSANNHITSLYYPLNTPEDKVRFAQTVSPLIEEYVAAGEDIDDYYQYLATIDYIMPSAEYLSEEEAVRISDEAIVANRGWKEENLPKYERIVSLRRLEDGSVIWYIKYKLLTELTGPFLYGEITLDYGMKVTINAVTGEVIAIDENSWGTKWSAQFE